MIKGSSPGKMWRKGRRALGPLRLLFLVLTLSLFLLPRTAEASVSVPMVSPGHPDGLPKHAPQYQWLFTSDVLVLMVADIRRSASEECKESRRSLSGPTACEIVSLQARQACALAAVDLHPPLCASAPPGFVPRL